MPRLETHPFDERSLHGAIVAEPRESRDLLGVENGEVIALFEAHGAILFRGFDLRPEQLSLFTDRFTHEYRRDTVRSANAYRRPVRFGQDHVTNVTLGRS